VSDSLRELSSVPCRPVSIKFIPITSTRAILQQSFSPARIRQRSRLHRALIAEFSPIGALEQNIVADIARLTWRKQNLATFRIAELAKERHQKIQYEKAPGTLLLLLDDIDPAAAREGYRAAEKQARQELGGIYQLIDIGEPATIKGLMDELDIKERLDSLISKCLKQLLMVRGVKSLSAASSSVPTPQISGPRKAG